MHDERARVSLVEGDARVRGLDVRLDRPFLRRPVDHGIALPGLLEQPLDQVAVRWKRIRRAPLRCVAQQLARPDGLLLALGNHSQVLTVAHHLHDPRQGPHGSQVHAQQARPVAGGPRDAPEQHVRQPQVLNERTARELCAHVDPRRGLADDAVGLGRLRRRLARDLALEGASALELAVADRARGPSRAHDAALDLELGERSAQPLGGGLQHDLPGLRRSDPHGIAAHLHRRAPGGHSFVRTIAGVRPVHLHLVEAHVELLRRNPRDRALDPLPDLHLSGRHDHGPVALDADPGVQIRIAHEARREWSPVAHDSQPTLSSLRT